MTEPGTNVRRRFHHRLDEIDAEVLRLTADIALAEARQTALVARFHERLGDNAVHTTERVRHLASGA